MVQLKTGEILIAYNDWTMVGENGDFSPAYVAARLSEDGGHSWGRPFAFAGLGIRLTKRSTKMSVRRLIHLC
jgi:hypothetical protein